MPERPDLRQISGSIRESLSDYDRDALVDILTYVFKEYVVEGPPPLLVSQAERLEDLEGMSFPELITALQTRLDLPELSLFDVDGDQVNVRIGGVKTLLSGPGAPNIARPAPRVEAPEPRPAEEAAPRPTPGVRVVETELPLRPPVARNAGEGSAAGAERTRDAGASVGMESRRGVAPRPTGLSISGRPAGAMAPPSPGRAEPPAGEPAPADSAPAERAPARDKSLAEAGDDDASIRFSLLELD